jgi:hypothetical protein
VLSLVAAVIMSQASLGIPLSAKLVAGLAVPILAKHGSKWVPSRSWYHLFLARLGLSFRRGTRAARHVPANHVDITLLFLQRWIWLIHVHDIHSALCLTSDETGQIFFPTSKTTWAAKGSKSVELVGLEEKRQFTVSPILSASGELAGRIQIIWGGKTDKCEPSADIKLKYDSTLIHTHTPSHWSTLDTVKKLIDDIYRDYVLPTMHRLEKNPATTKWVLLWDVFYSHRMPDLLTYLREVYPNLILFFVPPGCTPILAPLDVDFNAPWKKFVATLCIAWLSQLVASQLDAGTAAADVKIPINKKDLTPFFTSWLHAAVMHFRDQHEMIKRSFATVGNQAIVCGEKLTKGCSFFVFLFLVFLFCFFLFSCFVVSPMSMFVYVGLLTAWDFGSQRTELLNQATALHAAGQLWNSKSMNSKELPHFPSASPVDLAIALAAQRAVAPDSDDEALVEEERVNFNDPIDSDADYVPVGAGAFVLFLFRSMNFFEI